MRVHSAAPQCARRACRWPAATAFRRRTARLLRVTRRMWERGHIHAVRAAVVEGEAGRAATANRSARGAVVFDARAAGRAGRCWAGCRGRHFLDEWEAVMRCHAIELQAEGHPAFLLSSASGRREILKG